MTWVELGYSAAGVAALAWIARLLKRGESRIGDAAQAGLFAEELLAGFEARRAIVSGDGNAALVAGNGAIAVLRRDGARLAARRLIPPLDLRVSVEGVTIDTGERMFGAVTLFGVVADEVRALEASLTSV